MKLPCWTLAALLALAGTPTQAATAELLAFKPGNPQAQAALARVPEVRSLVEEQFAVDFVDLDGDRQMGVAAGEKAGTPMHRKPLIYPMQAQAGKAPAAATPVPPASKAAAGSATLETIVDALAIPVGAQQNPGARWAELARLPGMAWRDRQLRQRGRETVRSGQVALVGLGSTAITWEGMPDAAFAADVRTGTRVAPDKYIGVLKAQFSPAAALRVVRGGCKDAVFAQSAVFELVLPGKQPAYLLVDTKASWNDGNTTIQVSPVDETSRWAC